MARWARWQGPVAIGSRSSLGSLVRSRSASATRTSCAAALAKRRTNGRRPGAPRCWPMGSSSPAVCHLPSLAPGGMGRARGSPGCRHGAKARTACPSSSKIPSSHSAACSPLSLGAPASACWWRWSPAHAIPPCERPWRSGPCSPNVRSWHSPSQASSRITMGRYSPSGWSCWRYWSDR